MASKNNGFNLEENLVLSNEELTSNWAKFASFICSYEGITWDEARKKATDLMKAKTAYAYIDEVRQLVAGKIPEPTKPPTPKAPKTKQQKPMNQKTIYEKNYDRLMEIAPGLEEKLLNYKDGDEIYGKSVSTGYMDFNLELLYKDKDSFHIALSHYYESHGDLVPDPDMEIRVDVKNKMVEALHFRDAHHYAEVYDDKQTRSLVDRKQLNSQNRFLGMWLRNLKKQNHSIEWREEDETGVAHSIIEDHYHKEEEPKEQKTAKTPSKDEKAEAEPEVKEIHLDDLPQEEPDTKEEPKGAKIISLPHLDHETKIKNIKTFISIVAFREHHTFANQPEYLKERIQHILEHTGSTDYVVNAWDELQKQGYERIKQLNFLRLFYLFPDFIDLLHESSEKLRLVSQKSKLTYSMELGDSRNKDAKVLAIYALSTDDNTPTLLLKVNESKQHVTVDMSLQGFGEMHAFNASDAQTTELSLYAISIEFEAWLTHLQDNEYKAVVIGMKPVEQEQTQAIEQPEEEKEHDSHYINKDIPDFEPGHVLLTEAHIKRGVTQKMIDKINKTKEGIIVFARKSMINNTKNKIMDAMTKAKRPGFRLSATGKFYYESRSNRSDLGTKGL